MLYRSKVTLGLLLLAALCAGSPVRVCSQLPTSPSERSTLRPSEDANRWVPSASTLGQDALDIVRAPFELSPFQQLVTIGAAGFVTNAAATVDEPIFRRASLQSGRVSQTTKPLAAPGRWYDRAGPNRVILGTAGLLAASGLALQQRTLTRTSVRVVEALAYTKLVTGLAKSALNRHRPVSTSDPLTADVGAFSSQHTKLSMPSGHTARAFAVASVLSHQFDRLYVSIPAYGMAASVGLERVRSGDHWLTDVIVGGALGYFIGRSVSPQPTNRDVIRYAPILSTDRIGVAIRF